MPSSLLCHVINQNCNKWIFSATFANIQLCDIIEFWFVFKFILSCLPKLIEKLFSFSFSKFGYWVLASVKILSFFSFFFPLFHLHSISIQDCTTYWLTLYIIIWKWMWNNFLWKTWVFIFTYCIFSAFFFSFLFFPIFVDFSNI